jgi:hypothetical protein
MSGLGTDYRAADTRGLHEAVLESKSVIDRES